MKLTTVQREALEDLTRYHELIRKGAWWGNQTKEWLVEDWTMRRLHRLKLCNIDVIGESAFAVITPKGKRALQQ